ncbi:MAG: RdgB/HAM1 family non-canonical purine NTP pyrophosphatase [Aquificae bacterium]|nr:RdgB/HAM1 family non-canonical purine NTP pyrophosphatase [Aquificota bacterium]
MGSLKKVLVASSNPKKVREIEEILRPLGIEVVKPPRPLEVEEWANTFFGNAYLKAKAYYEAFGIPALADDSGLVVEALKPYPGVYSARFYSLEEFGKEEPVPSADAANVRKLLRALEGKTDRRAKFVSAVVLYAGEGKVLAAEGEVEGTIVGEPRGGGGFGYDPVFVPKGFEQTFAEMEPSLKHSLSHRGKALRRLAELLKNCDL